MREQEKTRENPKKTGTRENPFHTANTKLESKNNTTTPTHHAPRLVVL
jgi:hypothetical protein